MSNQKHLTLDQRSTIEVELNNKSSFKRIALLTGKDCTTISKEVKAHRTPEKTGSFGKGFNDCIHCHSHSCNLRYVCEKCTNPRPCWSCGKCNGTCLSYAKYHCPKLDKAPYVCNGCSDKSKCTLEKLFYRAYKAQKEYSTTLSESRSGIAISEPELQQLDEIISPLLIRGQSIHHISINHADEVMKSERTLYKYVNNGFFTARNIDMPRVVRMRPRKSKSTTLKVDKSCRIGRTFDDYQIFLSDNPDTPICQLDSVEGVKGGAVLLTVHFVKQELQIAFLRRANDSQSVIDIFEKLYIEMTPTVYMDIFQLLLTDNGSEFSNPRAIEYDMQGNHRTRVFYCDPNAPYQKGNCENNHEMIRRIIPKGTDFGKYTQEQINMMMSHINSYSRKSLGNKSPYDVFAFFYGEDILKVFNITKIPSDEITLTPELFRQ